MSVNFIIFAKYIIAILLLGFVVFLPAYLAQQTGKNKTDMTRIRIASWLLGWTAIAWIWSLFHATQK